MADSIFRAAPLYLNGKKIAEVGSSTYEVMDAGTNQVGIEGVLGQSDGAVESKMDFDTVVPIAGMQINIDDIIRSKARVGMGISVNGGFQIVRGKITGATYSSDSKTGECKGKYTFIGGEPQLT